MEGGREMEPVKTVTGFACLPFLLKLIEFWEMGNGANTPQNKRETMGGGFSQLFYTTKRATLPP